MDAQSNKELADIKLYIGTMGHRFPGYENGIFYPSNLPEQEYLRYYASKFNSILFRSDESKTEVYFKWLQSVDHSPNFKFIIRAPKSLTRSKTVKAIESSWNFFWKGKDGYGGYEILHKTEKLGCILIKFSSLFYFSTRSVKRLKSIMNIVPKDVRCAVEFRHWSWWENLDKTKEIFESAPNWCISTVYVENGLIERGWAGNLPSTRIQKNEEIVPFVTTTNFAFINFYGTMGKYLGSYDDNFFLERIVDKIKDQHSKGVQTIYCSFSNVESSYCFPLPGMFIAGLPLIPKMKELPSYAPVDLPCCLHDAQRLKTIWKDIVDCPYQTDKRGHIEMVFR